MELEPGALLLHPVRTVGLMWRCRAAFRAAQRGDPGMLEELLGEAVGEGLDVEYNGRRY